MKIDLFPSSVPVELAQKMDKREHSNSAQILYKQGSTNFVPDVPAVPVGFEQISINALNALIRQIAVIEGWMPTYAYDQFVSIQHQIELGMDDAQTILNQWQSRVDKYWDEQEAFEERAAIMQYDGGLSRLESEQLAMQQMTYSQ